MDASSRIDELIRAKISEEAFAIERVHFVKTDRMFNPKKVNPFKYFPGTLPVLVTAPHSVRHIRHKKIKPSDEFTGSIAYLLNSITGCHSMAVTRLYGGDPNFDSPCIFKDALHELAGNNDFTLVIDLHGASADHDFDVDIGTMRGESLKGKKAWVNELRNLLNNYRINNLSENFFTIAGNNTITSYVSTTLGIPAIQLEINKKFRVPHQNAESYCRIIGALTDFLNSFARDR